MNIRTNSSTALTVSPYTPDAYEIRLYPGSVDHGYYTARVPVTEMWRLVEYLQDVEAAKRLVVEQPSSAVESEEVRP